MKKFALHDTFYPDKSKEDIDGILKWDLGDATLSLTKTVILG